MTARPTTWRCCWCGEGLRAMGPTTQRVDLVEEGGARMMLRWHLEPECFNADELNHDLVGSLTAFGSAVTHEEKVAASERVARAYDAVRARVVEKHGTARAFVDVRRDLEDVQVTLRGDGDSWGRRSWRFPDQLGNGLKTGPRRLGRARL